MQKAIEHELDTGLGSLPNHLFSSHFNQSYKTLIQQNSLHQLQSWLQYVCFGRKIFDTTNLIQDDLPDLLRTWLGL